MPCSTRQARALRAARIGAVALDALGGAWASAPTAGAVEAPRALRLVSTPDSGTLFEAFVGASADGRRVFFRTAEAIAGSGDADTGEDVYERDADGTLRLVSTPNSGASDASFRGASADGSRVFFDTFEAISGTGDADTANDVYERDADGTLRLITTPNSATNPAYFDGASADGTRVFFTTSEAIPGTGDADTENDVYERDADGTLRLISTPAPAAENAVFVGASADGTRVFFRTGEAIAGTGDADTATDVYERDADGTLRLISTPNSPAGVVAVFAGASADGRRVFFETNEAIPGSGDADTARDVYERDADGTLRLVSTPNSGATDALLDGASADGTRVFFRTAEAIAGTGDADTAGDVYERDADGTLRLITTPNSAADGAAFAGASADGGRVFFTTNEAIAGTGDADTELDVYERDADGTLRLISTPNSAAGVFAAFVGASADGSRVFFRTAEAIAGTGDADTGEDGYERDADGTLRLVSTPNSGATDAGCCGMSADGSRVFFGTTEAIEGSGDADTGLDIYERSWSVPLFSTAARVAGTPAVGSVLTCVPGEVVGEGFTTVITWLRDGAPVAGAAGASYRAAAADVGHGLACRVTATNPIGSGTQTSPAVAVRAVDRVAPSARIATPRCPRKATRIACRRFRSSVRAWRMSRGTVTDPAPSSGIARVEVNVVRRTGKRCQAYNGKRFVKTTCAKANKRYVRATVRGTTWTLRLRGLRAGRYTIRARAVDRAGNRQAKPDSRKLSLR